MEKINIWGDTIPYNHIGSKLSDMKISRIGWTPFIMGGFFLALTDRKYRNRKREYDTFTYYRSIKSGADQETYEDVPTLTPFPVNGSKAAVIVVPGGGFSYRSSDADGEGKQSEGDQIAEALNEAGISAFVLSYRINPYRMPVEMLDMQRAVRWLRHHASDYGFDPDKIGAIGFSAGGFEVGVHINITGGKHMFPEGYVPDEVDSESDRLNNAALIYPCLTMKKNETLVYPLFGEEIADDETERKRVIREYDCCRNLHSADIPQFVSYGSKDPLLDPLEQHRYVSLLEERGADLTEVIVDGAGHGYGACITYNRQYRWWVSRYLQWVTDTVNRE